jgi:hypothetical protein
VKLTCYSPRIKRQMQLRPVAGFNWMAVSWGGPDEQRTDRCSYCERPFHEDEAPLILWNEHSWTAEFCEDCTTTWWGLEE